MGADPWAEIEQYYNLLVYGQTGRVPVRASRARCLTLRAVLAGATWAWLDEVGIWKNGRVLRKTTRAMAKSTSLGAKP